MNNPLQRATDAQHQEAVELNASLAGMSDDELAAFMLRVTDVRLGLEGKGDLDFLRPFGVLHRDPMWNVKAASLVAQYVREGDFDRGNALLIWLMTVRAASDDRLLELGRAMWLELSRSFHMLITIEQHTEADDWTRVCAREARKVPFGMAPLN